VWLTPITLTGLVELLAERPLEVAYLVRPPLEPSVFQLRLRTPGSRLMLTRRSLISSPGVWVPPTGLLTPEGERLFEYTQRGLRGLSSEITDTLLVSPETE